MESEKKHSADLEKKLGESQECSEERRKKLEDSDNKVQQLQDSMTRLGFVIFKGNSVNFRIIF